MQHTHVRTELKHVGKLISFTEFLTLLRLLTKKTFMNRNKREVTDLQGRCRAIKALAFRPRFGSGLYHMALTLPVLNALLRPRSMTKVLHPREVRLYHFLLDITLLQKDKFVFNSKYKQDHKKMFALVW